MYVENTYRSWLSLKKLLETVDLHDLIDRQDFMTIFQFRWNFNHSPVHGFAFLLNPSTARSPMCKGVCVVRHKRYDDYRDTIKQMKEHFKDFLSSKDLGTEAFKEYEKFCQDLDGDETDNPRAFWATVGLRAYPTLAKVASRIFQVQTSSASGERVWSILGFIESKSRNNMSTDTLEKLAFVKINNALCNKTSSVDWSLDEDFFFNSK